VEVLQEFAGSAEELEEELEELEEELEEVALEEVALEEELAVGTEDELEDELEDVCAIASPSAKKMQAVTNEVLNIVSHVPVSH